MEKRWKTSSDEERGKSNKNPSNSISDMKKKQMETKEKGKSNVGHRKMGQRGSNFQFQREGRQAQGRAARESSLILEKKNLIMQLEFCPWKILIYRLLTRSALLGCASAPNGRVCPILSDRSKLSRKQRSRLPLEKVFEMFRCRRMR